MQDIHVNDSGKGFPIVLVHGFLGSSQMWDPQIEHLKKKYRVLAPDLPGFGKSNNLESCSSIECMAQAILDDLNKKGLNKFHLIGHSMGGMIAQEIAKLSNKKIDKLILYGTGPRGNIPGRFETIDESRVRLKNDGLEVTVNRIAETWFVKSSKAKYFYLCSNAGKKTSFRAADNALIAMKNWNNIEDLKSIKNETLIIWGNQDKAYNFEQVQTLNNNLPNSHLEIMRDCSHNVHLEIPDKFNICVENFLKSE